MGDGRRVVRVVVHFIEVGPELLELRFRNDEPGFLGVAVKPDRHVVSIDFEVFPGLGVLSGRAMSAKAAMAVTRISIESGKLFVSFGSPFTGRILGNYISNHNF